MMADLKVVVPIESDPAEAVLAVNAPGYDLLIDEIALRAADLLPLEDEERRASAEYRGLKRALLARLNAGRVHPKLQSVMVASALPGEGKTFTSLNLSLSLCLERACNVILVDADVVRPHLSTMLGVQDRPGLMELAADREALVEKYLLTTNIPNLRILPAGKAFPDATEMLGGINLDTWRSAVRDGNRTIVILDSPPVLPTSESRAIADLVDQILLIVRAHQTPRSAVFEAIETLGHGRPLSLVLNQVRNHRARSYYDYGAYASRASNEQR